MPRVPKKPRNNAAIARLQAREIRERERRAKAFGALVAAWLSKYGRWREKQVRRTLEREGPKALLEISKARVTQSSLEQELIDLYERFGIQQIDASGKRWSASLGGKFIVTPEVKRRYVESIENKVVLLVDNTEQMVRSSIQRIMIDALGESPRPTGRELGRRIARQWHGAPSGELTGRGTEAERRATADWRRRETGGPKPGEQEALFSPARAALIARTELADADTAGALEGFSAVGVEKAAWIAKPKSDASGERRHYLMNSHPALPVAGLMTMDRDRWFKLPSDARGRRPADILLPVGERVNCRCVLVPRL